MASHNEKIMSFGTLVKNNSNAISENKSTTTKNVAAIQNLTEQKVDFGLFEKYTMK